MARQGEDLSVLFKQSSRPQGAKPDPSQQLWLMAHPNPDRKFVTQDQVRDESRKHLTADQRRHFELNTPLNRRGSLFGPKRDARREKTPLYASDTEEKDFAVTIVAPKPSEVSLVGGNDTREPQPSKVSVGSNTTRLPATQASVRGSDVGDDMRLLESMMPSATTSINIQDSNVSPSQDTSFRGKALELENQLFRIDDWIQMELRGEYLGKRKHFLRVVNTLDYDEKVMQVSNYQMLHEVVDFYALNYNSNAQNYVWKDIWGNTLDMHKSLGENGLMDQSVIIDELGLDHFPTILIYFKDGFENDPPMRLDISEREPDGIIIPCRNY